MAPDRQRPVPWGHQQDQRSWAISPVWRCHRIGHQACHREWGPQIMLSMVMHRDLALANWMFQTRTWLMPRPRRLFKRCHLTAERSEMRKEARKKKGQYVILLCKLIKVCTVKSLPSSDIRPKLGTALELIGNFSLSFFKIFWVATAFRSPPLWIMSLHCAYYGWRTALWGEGEFTACIFNKDNNGLMKNVPFMCPRAFHSCVPSTSRRVLWTWNIFLYLPFLSFFCSPPPLIILDKLLHVCVLLCGCLFVYVFVWVCLRASIYQGTQIEHGHLRVKYFCSVKARGNLGFQVLIGSKMNTAQQRCLSRRSAPV